MTQRLQETEMGGSDAQEHTPLSFLKKLWERTRLERRPLKFAYTRLNSLLRTLEVTNLDDYTGLTQVTDCNPDPDPSPGPGPGPDPDPD